MENINKLLAQAGQFLDSNQLVQAKENYLAICRLQDHPEARLMLGAIDAQLGRTDDAIKQVEAAIRLNPDYADAYVTLGSIYQQLQRPEEAHQCFLEATRLDEHYEEAWQLLGASFGQKADYQNAERCCRQALAIDPTYFEARVNLANALKSQGKLAEAISLFKAITQEDKQDGLILANLASALSEQGQFAEAEDVLGQLLQMQPGDRDARLRLAEVLHMQDKWDGARQVYADILEANPDDIDALVGSALVMADEGKLVDARKQLERVLARKPGAAAAMLGLAKIAYTEGRMSDAVSLFRRILDQLDPTAQAVKRLRYEAFSIYVFSLNYLPDAGQDFILAEHRRWADAYAPKKQSINFVNSRDAGKVLRVGYLSPDFRRHSVAFFVDALLSGHNRTCVEVFCYSNTKKPDATTEYLRGRSDHWRDISSLPDDGVIDAIRKDQIDILVDLAGHTTNNRLMVFANRAAPVQVSYLGYPNTTGLDAMDYRITDNIADPLGAEAGYSEQLIRIPDSFLCYSAYAQSPEVIPLPARASGHVTFCSFNALQKVTPDVVRVWANILKSVTNARLKLKNPALSHPLVRERLLHEFEEQGVGRDRIELYDLLASYDEHMAMYGGVDIALDTFPYNGTTTTCEALWMGVPVVTFAGKRHAARVGSSILHAIGHTEWVADSIEDYCTKAVALAANMDTLDRIRQRLRGEVQASRMCDQDWFVGNIEAAYREIWEAWCDR